MAHERAGNTDSTKAIHLAGMFRAPRVPVISEFELLSIIRQNPSLLIAA